MLLLRRFKGCYAFQGKPMLRLLEGDLLCLTLSSLVSYLLPCGGTFMYVNGQG